MERGVLVALGSDVGAGTGFGLPKEGLMAYKIQMLQPDGYRLTPAHLLYLATRAGREALGMDDVIGDLSPGKSRGLCAHRSATQLDVGDALVRAESALDLLGIVFTLAQEESIARVYVEGNCVYEREDIQ